MPAALARSSFVSRLRARVTIRTVRLTSGLVLFSYVTTHLLNHALGNVSLDAMEAGLDWVAWFWRRPLPGVALYAGLGVHAALGIWALYARPRFRWTLPEALQLGLGLALPILLVNHVTAARLAYTLFGTTTGYAQQLYYFFVAAPESGFWQAVALVTAWSHGCIGLYLWLRLKRGFPRAAPLLLCAAVLIPVLALLGFLQGGRAVVALAADESWRIENLPVSPGESPDAARQAAEIGWWRQAILSVFGAAAMLALAGRAIRRAAERRRGLVRITYPDGRSVRITRGTTVLEASRMARIPHASVCGGRGRCSTCRVGIFGEGGADLPPASTAEAAVLQRIGAGGQVRLACQLRPSVDIGVAPLIAPGRERGAAQRRAGHFGEERFVVAMFVDMRGSTRLAERRLPFDTVFLINRFLEAVSGAVRAAGGTPNQFLGDGLLALFGLQSGPEAAARAAIEAVAGIGAEIAALNSLLGADLPEPIRFGIGVHGGTAILGEIGGREGGGSVFTAIGDPVNVAARLQGATKRLNVEALVSDAVYEVAGIARGAPSREVAIEGRDGAIAARPITKAVEAGRAGQPAAYPEDVGAA